MKKIYIVTQGEYSDYRIVTVFDNKEEAQKFIDFKNKYAGMFCDYILEEYDMQKDFNSVLEGENNFIRLTYDSEDKDIKHEKDSSESDLSLYLYENYDSYEIALSVAATPQNILKAEKTIHDKVAEIEYKIQNDFNGDFRAYVKFLNKLKSIENTKESIKEGDTFLSRDITYIVEDINSDAIHLRALKRDIKILIAFDNKEKELSVAKKYLLSVSPEYNLSLSYSDMEMVKHILDIYLGGE